MNNYEYAKFLHFIFYTNCENLTTWKNYSNDFISQSELLIKNFFEYKDDASKQMISLFQKTSVAGEFEKIKELKKQWLNFVKLFGELENTFEEKYKYLCNEKHLTFDSEKLKEFLAEYYAYEKMTTAYESLLNLDMQIENYQKMCRFYQSQLQPV